MENEPPQDERIYRGTPIVQLQLELTRETDTRLHIKISDPYNHRYEIPER